MNAVLVAHLYMTCYTLLFIVVVKPESQITTILRRGELYQRQNLNGFPVDRCQGVNHVHLWRLVRRFSLLLFASFFRSDSSKI
jgi:hypothetical protein